MHVLTCRRVWVMCCWLVSSPLSREALDWGRPVNARKAAVPPGTSFTFAHRHYLHGSVPMHIMQIRGVCIPVPGGPRILGSRNKRLPIAQTSLTTDCPVLVRVRRVRLRQRSKTDKIQYELADTNVTSSGSETLLPPFWESYAQASGISPRRGFSV